MLTFRANGGTEVKMMPVLAGKSHIWADLDHGDDPGQILTHLTQHFAVAEFSVLICSAGARMPG